MTEGATAAEHRMTVQRTARYYTLGDVSPNVREIWVACHGYAQLARYFIRSFAPLAGAGRLVVAPEALNRYYFETAPGVHAHDARVAATWMTREDREHEIADYVAYLDALVDTLRSQLAGTGVAAGDSPPRIIALGFSQGAATVSRWAARGATRIHHVILWGSGVPHDLPLSPGLFRGAPLTIALGDADPHVSQRRMEAEMERLGEAGVSCRLVHYAGGHRIEGNGLLQVLRAMEAQPPG